MEKCTLKFTLISVVVCSSLYHSSAVADDYFEPGFIEGVTESNKNIDLSVFNSGGQAPGSYSSAIYLNRHYIKEQAVRYEHINDQNQLVPMLTKADYVELGVSPNATPSFMNTSDNDVIDDISKLIPDAVAKYNFEQQKLNISIPQQYIKRIAQGAVPDNLWDDGVNALFANYSYSGSSTKFDHGKGSQQYNYLNLRSGLNIGAWRLRNYSTYTNTENTNTWKSINTYIERDIKSLKSHLVMGDSYTPSDMFDSFSFRGAQLASDDAMQPSSMRGFAPIIRGIAQSNAQVTIRQNGNTIWQSYVPPGPFVIDDLYPTSSSGNLEVSIKEADGSVRTFVQPFSSVPVMLREGRFKYSLTAGEYRSQGNSDKKPNFIQATGIYGLPYTSTLYGGTILSKDYDSFLIGIGKSLGNIGSISIDSTIAKTKINNENDVGSAFRFQYSKDLLSTGTNISLAGYRYSSSKYRDFAEANADYNTVWYKNLNKRDRLQINLNQTLGDFGNIYFSGYQQRYWNYEGKERNLNFGYNANYNGIAYSFNYSNNRNLTTDKKDQIFSFNVQIPLDFMQKNYTWVSLSNTSDNRGNNTASVGLSGTALENNNLSYSVQESYTNRGVNSTGNVSANYKASFGEYRVGYNYTRDSRQINYSTMGGVVLHPYGLTFSQSLGQTVALIRAEDADNVNVMSNPGVSTDRQGNAIVPYVTPYQRNDISLDTTNLGARVDLSTNTKSVIPTRGAVVLADFPTSIGYKAFITLQGENIPFGAKATVDNNGTVSSGIVDDGQKVYLTGVPNKGVINVSWSNGECKAPYKLAESKTDIVILSVQCH